MKNGSKRWITILQVKRNAEGRIKLLGQTDDDTMAWLCTCYLTYLKKTKGRDAVIEITKNALNHGVENQKENRNA